MPELPEVEITRRGIEPSLLGASVSAVRVRQAQLRYPVPEGLDLLLPGQVIGAVRRRAKYILIDFDAGALMVHLGMTGSLRIVAEDLAPEKHDHFDLVIGTLAMRLRDPRRFGSVLWLPAGSPEHPLLGVLGQEPLAPEFDGALLARLLAGRRTPVKLAIMNSHLLVGVGNIYASESLFRARIHPAMPAALLGARRCMRLAAEIRQTLEDSLAAGGSTLRDFMHSDGSPGYFQQHYFVYGRDGLPCQVCGTPILRSVMGQRATFHCPRCQRLPSGAGR